jgi:hypothetical protein
MSRHRRSKELIAGFWLWQVKSKQEAIEWVKRSSGRCTRSDAWRDSTGTNRPGRDGRHPRAGPDGVERAGGASPREPRAIPVHVASCAFCHNPNGAGGQKIS